MALAHQPQSYPADSSNYESSSVQLEDFTHSEYEVPLVVSHHPMQVQQPNRSALESSEMSVGDESSHHPMMMMDDIQQSILKAQKAKRNKQKKQKKKQRKVEKEVEVVVEHPNPILGHILKSFAAEENSQEMLQAVKAVNGSPILGEVLLQLYLRLKESQNETCKAQLAEQELLSLLKLKDLELAEKDVEILDL